MFHTDHPSRLTAIVTAALTAILIVAGGIAGWSGETMGTALMGVVVVIALVRAFAEPKLQR